MPYARTSTGYPTEMKLAIMRVVEMNMEMEVDCGSEGAAKNLRGRYYQYLAAVKRDASNPPVQWTEHEKKENLDFLRAFVTVEFYPKGRFFYIRPRDLAPWANALAKGKLIETGDVLEREATAVPADEQSGALSEAEQSAARLMEKMEDIKRLQEKAKKFGDADERFPKGETNDN